MVTRLAHVDIAVDDLDVARSFYLELLGLEEYHREPETLYLRAPTEFDAWSLKLTAAAEPGLITFGLRVATSEDLDRLRDLHHRLDIPAEVLAEDTYPGRGPGLRVRVPGGHTVEFHHEIDEVVLYDATGVPRLPGRASHRAKGIRVERLDHVNLRMPNVAEALAYWVNALSFSMSEAVVDERGTPVMAWLRRSPKSHDVAVGVFERPGFHHLAFTLADSSALSAAADLLADAGLQDAIEFGPGRHGATNAHAMYIKDPAGNRIELYTGDYVRDLDRPAVRWDEAAYRQKGLLWWGRQAPPSFSQPAAVLGVSQAVPR